MASRKKLHFTVLFITPRINYVEDVQSVSLELAIVQARRFYKPARTLENPGCMTFAFVSELRGMLPTGVTTAAAECHKKISQLMAEAVEKEKSVR